MKSIVAAATRVAAMLSPTQASVPAASDWQVGSKIYARFPTVKGITTFSAPPGSSGGSDLGVDAADILDNLSLVFMGSREARNGRWGGFTDLVCMSLGDTRSQTLEVLLGRRQVPADVSGRLDDDLEGSIWTRAGRYRAIADPGLELDTFLGARMVDLDQSVAVALSGNVGSIALADRSGSRRASLNHLDAIVGVKGRVALGADRTWFGTYYADVGTGESDLTCQLMAGVGYAFEWGEMLAQWRYLDDDFGEKVNSLSLDGPAIAVSFRW